MILIEKTVEELGYHPDQYKAKLVFCQCDYCDKIFKRRKDSILSKRHVISVDICNTKECKVRKQQESMVKKYGENYRDMMLERCQKTCKEKYGTTTPFESKAIRDKAKTTHQEK
ncbi:unnamed protein product, partial [marine sediment metagenome]